MRILFSATLLFIFVQSAFACEFWVKVERTSLSNPKKKHVEAFKYPDYITDASDPPRLPTILLKEPTEKLNLTVRVVDRKKKVIVEKKFKYAGGKKAKQFYVYHPQNVKNDFIYALIPEKRVKDVDKVIFKTENKSSCEKSVDVSLRD